MLYLYEILFFWKRLSIILLFRYFSIALPMVFSLIYNLTLSLYLIAFEKNKFSMLFFSFFFSVFFSYSKFLK